MDLGGVNRGGGHGDDAAGDNGAAGRAVGDLRGTRGDGDQLSGVVGGDGILGHGRASKDGSGSSETHLDGKFEKIER